MPPYRRTPLDDALRVLELRAQTALLKLARGDAALALAALRRRGVWMLLGPSMDNDRAVAGEGAAVRGGVIVRDAAGRRRVDLFFARGPDHRRLAGIATNPKVVTALGPAGMRSDWLMTLALRWMGNLVTDEDRDRAARVWRWAGRRSVALDTRAPFA